MESRLIEENGRVHFMTKRLTVKWRKIHTQTLCAIQHYDFAEYYVLQLRTAISDHRQLKLTHEAEQMYKRMVFNVIARNCG